MDDTFNLPSLILNERQLCDLEMLLNGAFSPLNGFLGQADYESVLTTMRLSNGTIWPMPITLDVTKDMAETLEYGQKICLKDPELFPLAILKITSIWQPDKLLEAQAVFASQDGLHPGVFYLMNHTAPYYLGGKLELIELPHHYDFKHLRLTPDTLKTIFQSQGWERVVAFQTRNPMHRAHYELTMRAMEQLDAHLLLHPVVGLTPPGDVDAITRVCCYEKIMQYYPTDWAQLALLPLAMRMAGPREALWHAIIRKNYGCTHFIIGRDHAGPGKNSQGTSFYSPYAAQELVAEYQIEIDIEMAAFEQLVYVQETKTFVPVSTVDTTQTVLSISGSQFRQKLYADEDIPEWYSYPEVIAQLRHDYPLKYQQGFTVFFTGLSGSGKSTLANVLLVKLRELTNKQITLLDGDLVRQMLSSGLSFSKQDRDLNVARISYVASEITKHRGVALCAPIAPYEQARVTSREIVEQYGGFIEVYVSTSLETCEQRDPKGLYQQARAGKITDFTGIDSPYEQPVNPDVVLDTKQHSIDASVYFILEKIIEQGYLPASVRCAPGYCDLAVSKE